MGDTLMTCQGPTLCTHAHINIHTHAQTHMHTHASVVTFRKRVKESIFPGSLPPNTEAPGNTRVLPKQQTNLEQLARPSQMVKTAIANLINYQVITGCTGQSGFLFH